MTKLLITILTIGFGLPNVACCQQLTLKSYIYHNSKDTIYFTKMIATPPRLGTLCLTPKIIDSIQVDGKGKKEIVFARSCTTFVSDHGGSFDISETKAIGKYEIWNLDTKVLVFEAVNYVKNDFERFRAGMGYQKGSEFYRYDFQINASGVITIKYLDEKLTLQRPTRKSKKKSKANLPVFTIRPDKEEGTYRFVNGQYVKS